MLGCRFVVQILPVGRTAVHKGCYEEAVRSASDHPFARRAGIHRVCSATGWQPGRDFHGDCQRIPFAIDHLNTDWFLHGHAVGDCYSNANTNCFSESRADGNIFRNPYDSSDRERYC